VSLKKWNQYLHETNNTLSSTKQNSPISSVIDYFYAPNLLDTFYLGSDFNYDNSQFQFLQKNSILLNENTISDIQS
jgi:hypothetical protein